MKYIVTLLLLSSFGSLYSQNHLNPIEALLAEGVKPLVSQGKQLNLTSVAKITGRLFDRDSNELILVDGISFSINLFKKHPRFDDWIFVESKDSANATFEFNNLEQGEYALYVYYSSYTPESLALNKFYVKAIWSASGNHSCIHCDLNSDRIITIDSDQTEVQADFKLEKGGLLAVSITNNQSDVQGNFRITGMNENHELFQNSILFTQINSNWPNQTTYDVKAMSILPLGQYRFFTETHVYFNQIFGGETCEACEFDLLQLNGTQLFVEVHQTIQVDITLKPLTSSVSGRIDVTEPTDRTLARLINYNYRTQFADVIVDDPFEFTLTGINPGIYFLRHKSYFSENNFHYEGIYGGTYCGEVNCNLAEATPILVAEYQDISLQPHKMLLGGSVSGVISDSNDGFILQDPYLNLFDYNGFIEFYDENKRYVGIEEIVTYLDEQPSISSYQHILPAGKYYVKTGSTRNGESNRNYVDQIYPNINCAGFYCDFSQAELITVVAGETVSGINFNLQAGYGIRGKVTSSGDGKELKGISILVYDETLNFLGATQSGDSGDYGFFNLPNGDYYISTANGTQSYKVRYAYPEISGFQDQLYPNTVCPNNQCDFSTGEKVSVLNSDVTAVNFELIQANALTGTVTDSKTGQPIEHLTVGLYQADGIHIGNYKTNHLGFYATGALPFDDYLIKTQAHNLYPEFVLGYGTCLYGDCNVSDGTAFAFVENQAVNFELSHKKDLYAAYSGNWYQPNESGHGFQFEVISQNDASYLYVTWFAHLNGKPIWLTGTGLLLGQKAYVNLYITDGRAFPQDMNAEFWGALRVNFSDLNHATASWKPVLTDFSDGELALERLTVLSSAYSTDENIGACFSGSYYDAERNGEGMVIEALGEPTNQLLITWYSYRGDEQFWMVGNGTLEGNEATLTTRYTQGTSFTPDFNPNDLSTIVWGEVKVTKINNYMISVDFNPNAAHTDFASHQTVLNKLTEIHTLSCQDP